MLRRLPPGPFKTMQSASGHAMPFYIIPFNEDGECDALLTRRHLLNALAAGTYTDVFLFSHGWNNDWETALNRYKGFIEGYLKMRVDAHLPDPQRPGGFRPLLVGVFWPSTALVFGQDEVGPQFAGSDEADTHQALNELARAIDPAQRERFFEIAEQEVLDKGEALELARMAVPIYAIEDDETGQDAEARVEGMVRSWVTVAAVQTADDAVDEEVLDFDFGGGAPAGGPEAAGFGDWFKKLDPRYIYRMLTVRQMKDRGGRVGVNGVGPLLRMMLAQSTAHLHLLGHSYGCKVILSALCAKPPLARNVDSVLLLQPAVSHLCFAKKVPGTDRPGGYRNALARTNNPILTTFTKHDSALTKFFHYALTRGSDLGELGMAGAPSPYAALGGFGPSEADASVVGIQLPPQVYNLTNNPPEIYALKGDATISGHGDISNTSTWWALYNLVSATT